MIRTISKSRDKIREVIRGNLAKATMGHIFRVKNRVRKTTEMVLAWYVDRQNRCGVPIDGPMIWYKVKALYKEVARKTNKTNLPEFKASRGSNFNFMKCPGIRKVKVSAVQAFPSMP